MAVSPLYGVRVLELGGAVAGPVAAQVLADNGAEVIKVEPLHGDITRGAHVSSPTSPYRKRMFPNEMLRRQLFFNEMHRGKLAMALNLSRRPGKEIFRRLVQISDVVLENYSPRVMKNLGLDFPTLQKEKPDIIMVSLSAFGATGPYSSRVAYGPSINASSGLSHLTGYGDGPPLKPGQVFSDYFCGLTAAYATLVAVLYRKRTGRGQHLEIAMREAETMVVGEAIMDYVMNGRVQRRIGNDHPWMAPHGCYPCKGNDKWITIAITSDDEWQKLIQAMEMPSWAKDERFRNSMRRWENRRELDSLIAEWTTERERDELMESLQKAGIAAGAVLDVKKVVEHPQLKERGYFTEMMHPSLGRVLLRTAPWKLPSTPTGVTGPGPAFAQHNDHVFGELLAMSGEAIARLYEEGVTTSTPQTP